MTNKPEDLAFKKWWNKQNDITLRMASPEVIAKAAWEAGQKGRREKDASVFLLLHAKYNISKQEYKVLKGMHELKSRQEIADSIGIERNTVNAHAITLFKKLGVNTSVDACAVLESISDQ